MSAPLSDRTTQRKPFNLTKFSKILGRPNAGTILIIKRALEKKTESGTEVAEKKWLEGARSIHAVVNLSHPVSAEEIQQAFVEKTHDRLLHYTALSELYGDLGRCRTILNFTTGDFD